MKTFRSQNGAPPYLRTDWRARVRRVLEGWMPLGLHNKVRRVQLAILFRERLSNVPHVALPLHKAWFRQADIKAGERLARERKLG